MLGVEDDLAAYLLDGAVVTFGNIIENALMETIEVGMGNSKKRIQRYTFKELMGPSFTFPRENTGGGDFGLLKRADNAFYDEVG